ncbi:MAG: 50S ribosomal protein L4 [Flavobacteriales bacterium]|nr:50S ribosomal protein L4 [Flavobacteriales bacterium]
MKLEVLNTSGQKTGKTVTLDDTVFAIEPNDHAIYLDVKRYLAAQRTGTHKTKHRGEIHGSTRKLHRQKGTGGSRKGSIKNPLFRQGGSIFGPRPRNYDIKVNKSTQRLARKSALSYKAKENGIMVLDAIAIDKPKTKDFAGLLKNLNLVGKKTLVLIPERNDNVFLSSRNLEKANVQIASLVNTYDIMNSHNVVFVGNAHEMVTELLKK